MGLFRALKTGYRISTFCLKVGGNLVLGSLNALASTMETSASVLEDINKKQYDAAANKIENKLCNMGKNLDQAFNNSCQFLDEISHERSMDKIFSNENVKKASQLVLLGGGIICGIDALDGDDNETISSQNVQQLPLISTYLDPDSIHNGMFIGDESDLQALIHAGEDPNSIHVNAEDIERSFSVKQAFLEMHGYDGLPEGYEIHHIVPLSEGGSDSTDNMILVSEEDHEKITAAHRQFYEWNA